MDRVSVVRDKVLVECRSVRRVVIAWQEPDTRNTTYVRKSNREAPTALSNLLSTEEPTPSSRWKTWTGVSLLGLSAATLATGMVWLAIDGKPLCNAPAGGTCYWLRDTKTQGWVALGLAMGTGIAGGVLLWQGSRGEARIALGPASLMAAGRF